MTLDEPVLAERTFAALADPVRRSLLLKLAENSPRSATRLAEEYRITRQGVLKHLTILKDAGLVSVNQSGKEKLYSFRPEPLDDIQQWIAQLEALWDQRLLRLKTLIESEPKREG